MNKKRRILAKVVCTGGVICGSKPVADDKWVVDNPGWHVVAPDGSKHKCRSFEKATELCDNMNFGNSWQEELRRFRCENR